MKNKKTIYCLFLTKVVPSDMEHYLEKMAAEGWNLDKVGQWSSLKITFHKSEPKQYRYVYDMQIKQAKNYIQMYKDFGWEYLGQTASSHLWRKEYTGERPEAFTDAADIASRNKRFIGAVSVSFFMFLACALALPIVYAFTYAQLDLEQLIQFIAAFILSASLAAYLGWVIFAMYKNRNNK